MRLRGRPIAVPTPDPAFGDETDVSVALILMDRERHAGKRTGWYWTRPQAGAVASEPELWRAAVREGRGPLDHIEDAFLAAQTATAESADLAGRIDAAARALRDGRIEPTIAGVLGYVDAAEALDAERRRPAEDA